jgi:glycosyltransferase involved in cell wall biosynthesis
MVRIALIAGTYAPDRCGVAHYTAHLRSALVQRGIESCVLTTHAAANAIDDPTVIGSVKAWNLTNLRSLVGVIHRTNADILHIQHAAGTYGFDRSIFLLPLLLNATGWNRPIITTIHEYGWWEWQPRWIPQQILEWLKVWGQKQYWWDREDGFLITRSNAIITTNEEAERVIADRLPLFNRKLYRIPIGANVEVAPIDRTTAGRRLLQTCNWSDDAVVIAFFGFLHPVKGLETLLSAFRKVLQKQPQARLILIGGVESLALQGEDARRYWEKLETIINADRTSECACLNLAPYVHMTGYVDAKTASHYLTGSDLGVLPFNHGVTLKSGSLLALMAHGLPVIATRSSDSELQQSTLIQSVAPRNVDALATELQQLIENSTLRQHLSRQGRQFSLQFTWNTIADAHLDIYRSVTPTIDSPFNSTQDAIHSRGMATHG